MDLVIRKTSRQEFQERKSLLQDAAPSVFKQVFPSENSGRLPERQLTDQTIFSAKKAGAVTSFDEIFKSDDSKVSGVRNIAQARLDSNRYMVVNRLILESAVAVGGVETAVFDGIADDVMAGEIEVLVDKKPVITRMPIRALLNNAGNNDAKSGVAFLDNPKFLAADKEITVRMWFPAALAADTCIYFGLAGTGVENH